MTQNNKALVIYHSSDNDGIFSGKYARSHLMSMGYSVTMMPLDYGEAQPNIKLLDEYDITMITDFSLKPELMLHLFKAGKLIWYDHHKSSMDDAAEHGYSLCNGVRDLNNCATYLVYTDLFGASSRLVNLIDAYDLWKTDKECWRDALKMDLYLKTINPAKRAGIDYVSKQNLELGAILLRAEEEKVKKLEVMSFRLMTNFGPLVVPAINGYNNLAHSVLNVDDILVMFTIRSKDKVVFNLRSKTTDVGIIATANGGGGHKHAAGFIGDINMLTNALT